MPEAPQPGLRTHHFVLTEQQATVLEMAMERLTPFTGGYERTRTVSPYLPEGVVFLRVRGTIFDPLIELDSQIKSLR